MNGKKAKAIRKLAYGANGSYRVRDYRRDQITGVITGGNLLRVYRQLKRVFSAKKIQTGI